ncbi:P-loop containing nucleoside triphosphate hydrolase protein, partial [Chytriomyces sp. MP71]
WSWVQNLRSVRGLSSVALDDTQETLLHRDLETFARDREFYKRMGLPYRRGYLFSGKPGTGKTSLINAISATYNRDLYYVNLQDIKSDNELQSAFASVPKNSIIVFEDIDSQTIGGIGGFDFGDLKLGKGNLFSGFTLSMLLNCLDGHMLAPNVIIIMTTNHPEVLDPALIRPGRIDLHLSLGFCTHYQFNRMLQCVLDD